MTKPESNLPPAAQEWGRSTDREIAALQSDVAHIHREIERVSAGDGTQAGAMAQILSRLTLLEAQMTQIYTATGNTYPPTPPAPAPEQTKPADVQYGTVDVTSEWSRTWGTSSYYTGGGEYTNATYLYQGSSPENKIGMFRFNVGDAYMKKITGGQLFLQNINSPWSATFNAGLGTHGNPTAPTGKPGRQNAFDVGWGRGEGKWINLPDWVLSGLSNGSIQGFTVGGIGPSNTHSAYFQGNGQPSPPRLRLTYIK